MTSLTRAKKVTRVFALGIGAGLVVLIVGRLALTLIDSIGPSSQPGQLQQSQLQLTYGPIPQPKLPTTDITTAAATLELDLVRGNFPQSSASASVFKLTNTSLSLSAQDRARAKATNLGFTTQPTQPTPSTFYWEQDGRSLTVNLKDQTLSLRTNITQIDLNARQSFTRFTPIGQQSSQFIQNQFKFSDLQYNSSDSPDSQFVNPFNGQWLPQPENAVTPTNYAHITFLRQPLAGLPIYSSAGKYGPISMVIIPALPADERTRSSSSSNLQINQVVELDNNYIPIQQDDKSTYPIINAQTAFTKLQQNLGDYLVNVTPINSSASISSFLGGRVQFASLVYLEPDQQNTGYVQPAWMFEGRGTTDSGDARWVAYVPAIDSDLVDQLLIR